MSTSTHLAGQLYSFIASMKDNQKSERQNFTDDFKRMVDARTPDEISRAAKILGIVAGRNNIARGHLQAWKPESLETEGDVNLVVILTSLNKLAFGGDRIPQSVIIAISFDTEKLDETQLISVVSLNQTTKP